MASLRVNPTRIRDSEVPFEAPDLHRAVSSSMGQSDEKTGRRWSISAYTEWVLTHLASPDDHGQLPNDVEDLITSDRTIIRVDQVAQYLRISTRSVQRLAQRYVGLPLLAMIRRYRLQEAAQRLREDHSLTITQVAADLSYADHAHRSADF